MTAWRLAELSSPADRRGQPHGDAHSSDRPEPLSVSSPVAAQMLGISQRTLWSITSPRGDLRCVRIGQRVLYPVEELRRWLAEHAS